MEDNTEFWHQHEQELREKDAWERGRKAQKELNELLEEVKHALAGNSTKTT